MPPGAGTKAQHTIGRVKAGSVGTMRRNASVSSAMPSRPGQSAGIRTAVWPQKFGFAVPVQDARYEKARRLSHVQRRRLAPPPLSSKKPPCRPLTGLRGARGRTESAGPLNNMAAVRACLAWKTAFTIAPGHAIVSQGKGRGRPLGHARSAAHHPGQHTAILSEKNHAWRENSGISGASMTSSIKKTDSMVSRAHKADPVRQAGRPGGSGAKPPLHLINMVKVARGKCAGYFRSALKISCLSIV